MRGTRFALAARIAGALLLAATLTFTTAPGAGASTTAERAVERMLLPEAGWNGRAVRAPHGHRTVRTATTPDAPPPGWSAGAVGLGTGFQHPGGSDRVREVQRRLTRLGYHVGPVDGLFGHRTRASVGWFQLKHGLPVTGRATLATVRHLRARTAPGRTEAAIDPAVGERRLAAAERAPAWEAFRQLVGSRVPVPGGRGEERGTSVVRWLLIALAVVNALLLLGVQLWRRPAADPTAEPGEADRRQAGPPAASEWRTTRRFAPPVPVMEDRPPGEPPARSREARP